MSIQFVERDLECFACASGDRNPLHMDPEYARRTSFGAPVVFGALGLLASLGKLTPEQQRNVIGVRADFHRPMFLDVTYGVEVFEREGHPTVRLKDGSVPVLTAAFLLGSGRPAESITASSLFERSTARKSAWSDLAAHQSRSAAYRADSHFLLELLNHWSVAPSCMLFANAVAWTSYVIGMDTPGERALFFRLQLHLTAQEIVTEAPPFQYAATITDKNDGRKQLRIAATLSQNGNEIASAHLTSFFRPEIEEAELGRLASLTRPDSNGRLEGKRALLIGGSRGFGAALALALLAEGARVEICSRSEPEWLSGLPNQMQDRLCFEQADAADAEALAAIHDRFLKEEQSLDLLVCLAFPPISSLRLEPNSLARLNAYVSKAQAMLLTPLCTFLPALAKSEGSLVLVSSSAVEHPVREWPHYVAAKAAAEAFVQVAALQYPNISTLVFRPERMATEMTNTPVGRIGAASPHRIARSLVEQLINAEGQRTRHEAMEQVLV